MPRKIKPPSTTLSQRSIPRLDWHAYFIEFCRVHGEPVEYKGRLLFRDGWTYSSTNYEGPEYEPPTNNAELDALTLQYWQIRQTLLRRKMYTLLDQKESYDKQQSIRSIPLQQVTQVSDGEKLRRSYKPLDISTIKAQIEWIEEDLHECNQRITEIEEYNRRAKHA